MTTPLPRLKNLGRGVFIKKYVFFVFLILSNPDISILIINWQKKVKKKFRKFDKKY